MPDLPLGTKRAILDLLSRRELAPDEIAEGLGVTGTAIRQHLATLLAEGLVERRRADPVSGRPNFLYRLTDEGRRSYPKRYDVLVDELLAVLVERHGSDRAVEYVTAAGRRLGRRVARDLGPRGSEERRRRALAWLEETFGWEGSVEVGARGGVEIVVHRCPLQDVAPDRALICGAFFTGLVAALLDARSVRHAPLGVDLRCCAIRVSGSRARA